jgi:hypothetical protein
MVIDMSPIPSKDIGKEVSLQARSPSSIVMTFLVRECYGSPKKQEF